MRGATLAAAALDGVRVLSFAVLGAYAGWQARWSPLLFATLIQPPAFALIVWGKEPRGRTRRRAAFRLRGRVSYSTAFTMRSWYATPPSTLAARTRG